MNTADLSIALVSPFSWGVPSAVNTHVAELARELRSRGCRPVVVVSSDQTTEVGRMRALCRDRCRRLLRLLPSWEAGEEPPSLLLPTPGTGPLGPDDGVPVVPLGRSFPIRLNGSVANVGLPVDVMSRLERLLISGGLDVVHVHEPIAPSLSFTAVRESRSPVVATFHLSPVALAGYELERSLLESFYQRLDGRIATSSAGAETLGEVFSGDFEVVSPGTRVVGGWGSDGLERGTVLYVYRGDDRRGLRAFLKALSGADIGGLERVVVAMHRPSALRWAPRAAPPDMRVPLTWHEFDRSTELSALYRRAEAVVLPYLGGEWLLTGAVEASSAGRSFAGPDLPVTRRFAAECGYGALFSPGSEDDIRRNLARLLGADREAPKPATEHGFDFVADGLLQMYRRAANRAKEGAAGREHPISLTEYGRFRSPRAGEGLIFADLHIHTDHSKDSTNSVEDVLATAREVGLSSIAIADHDTISGALAARELAGDDIQVIVAEEVKTQVGEVIGLFLEEEVPPGLSFDETLARIKRQGGLVYIPHPFDGLRATPSYESMVDNLYRIDVIETYNARVALSSFNVNAERFAGKYNIPAGAGSDAHVLPGIGTAMLRMRPFSGPEEFLDSLREADIVTRRKSLLYLQSLKLVQTTLDHVLPRE